MMGPEEGVNMDAQAGKGANSPQGQAPSRWLRIGFWACIVISVAVVVRRVFALAYPPHSAPPQLAGPEENLRAVRRLVVRHSDTRSVTEPTLSRG